MKYDVIIAGGGPAGLMAAKTAAEDGLKAIVIEKKKNIAEVHRACVQIFYINKLTPDPAAGKLRERNDGYIEDVSVTVLPDRARLNFDALGFSVDFTGCLRGYYDWVHVSPNDQRVSRHKPNDKIWGFYYDKSAYLAELLAAAQKAGARVVQGSVLGAENTPTGVTVRIRTQGGEETTLEGRACIAADGINSAVVESLGLNRDRKEAGPRTQIVYYLMEGIRYDLRDTSWVTWTVPSLNPTWNFMLGMSTGETNMFGAITRGEPCKELIEKFMKDPRFAHIFQKAKVVGTMATAPTIRLPLKSPVAGNVLICGDAGSAVETWVQGATACGRQAVKAIEKEAKGEAGFAGYTAWWKGAFAFNRPDYFSMVPSYPLNRICSDEEVDYLYGLFQGETGAPPLMVEKHLPQVKKDRPALYEKLVKAMPARK